MKDDKFFLYLWLALTSVSISSCMFYTKIESYNDPTSNEDESLIEKSIYRGLAGDDYLVLRDGSEMWHIYDLSFSEEENTLVARTEAISDDYLQIVDGIKNKKVKGYSESQRKFVHQVHFYLNKYEFDQETKQVIFSTEEIIRLDVYKHDKAHSKTNSSVLIVMGMPFIGLPILFVLTLLFLLIP